MSDLPKLTDAQITELLRPTKDDAPLVVRLRRPPRVHSPVSIRMEAADRITALEAENARLREALEEILGMGFDEPMTFSGSELDWARRRASLMQGIARAALKEGE